HGPNQDSKGQPDCELKVPLRVGPEVRGVADSARVGSWVGISPDLRIRPSQVYVVEQVDRIEAQLRLEPPGERQPLQQRGIHPPVARPSKRVPFQITERPDRRPAESAPGRPD